MLDIYPEPGWGLGYTTVDVFSFFHKAYGSHKDRLSWEEGGPQVGTWSWGDLPE